MAPTLPHHLSPPTTAAICTSSITYDKRSLLTKTSRSAARVLRLLNFHNHFLVSENPFPSHFLFKPSPPPPFHVAQDR